MADKTTQQESGLQGVVHKGKEAVEKAKEGGTKAKSFGDKIKETGAALKSIWVGAGTGATKQEVAKNVETSPIPVKIATPAASSSVSASSTEFQDTDEFPEAVYPEATHGENLAQAPIEETEKPVEKAPQIPVRPQQISTPVVSTEQNVASSSSETQSDDDDEKVEEWDA